MHPFRPVEPAPKQPNKNNQISELKKKHESRHETKKAPGRSPGHSDREGFRQSVFACRVRMPGSTAGDVTRHRPLSKALTTGGSWRPSARNSRLVAPESILLRFPGQVLRQSAHRETLARGLLALPRQLRQRHTDPPTPVGGISTGKRINGGTHLTGRRFHRSSPPRETIDERHINRQMFPEIVTILSKL